MDNRLAQICKFGQNSASAVEDRPRVERRVIPKPPRHAGAHP